MALPAALPRILPDIANTAPLVIVAGGLLGAGITDLLVGPLGIESRLALEALVLGGLQIFAPVVVNLIWVSRSAAFQVAHGSTHQGGEVGVRRGLDWHPREFRISAAVLTVLLLLPYFLASMFLAAIITTPRADLLSELSGLMGMIHGPALLQCVLRTGFFAVATTAVCLHKGSQHRAGMQPLPQLISDAIIESYLLVIALEILWLAILDPLHVTIR
jgi:hypothetical protein